MIAEGGGAEIISATGLMARQRSCAFLYAVKSLSFGSLQKACWNPLCVIY